MTNEEILRAAVKKAKKNGWPEAEAHLNLLILLPHQAGKTTLMNDYYRSLIFSHGFAQAFWSCKHENLLPYRSHRFYDVCQDCKEICPYGLSWYTWLNHLENMVKFPEPLKYIEKFL